MSITHRITPSSPVGTLSGVGERQSQLLRRLGIVTVGDLISHQPRRWEDFSQITPIAELSPGRATLKARILEAKGRYLGHRGLHLTEALAQDESGAVRLIWFNQPYRATAIKSDSWYYVSGTYDFKYRHLQMVNPSLELVEGETSKLGLVRPVYPTTAGLKTVQLRRMMLAAKEQIAALKETLPGWLAKEAALPPLAETCLRLHFPASTEEALAAESELYFRRLISFSLSSQLLKAQRQARAAQPIEVRHQIAWDVAAELDFQLTPGQRQIITQILDELASGDHNLNRLVQGDVSSGKTLIAGLIALAVVKAGGQVAFLAPTQILARQHFQSLREIYHPQLDETQMALLTADLKPAERRRLSERLASGDCRLVIGTHALLSEGIRFKNLALAVVDEQHRFGVEQRLKLLEKAADGRANILTLSATPIPRSLALVLCADLDISILSEKPPGRPKIETSIIPLAERRRLRSIFQNCSPRNQLYIICPAIEDAETEDSLVKVEGLLKSLAPDLKYGLLHARLAAEAKERIMVDFLNGSLEALLATSIVGAGLDIPNANTVVIMSPERFGLAQLHQMRGRVGRGQAPGLCYLCPFSDQPPSERLRALLGCDDGFELSELDLRLRGPGTLYGLRQSGLDSLFGRGQLDQRTVEKALGLARSFIERGEQLERYPGLAAEIARQQQLTHLN